MSTLPLPRCANPEEIWTTAIIEDSRYRQGHDESSFCLSYYGLEPNMLIHVDGAVHTPLSLAIMKLPDHEGYEPIDEKHRLANSPSLVEYLIRKNAYIGSKSNAEKGITQPEGAPLPLPFAVTCGKPHIVLELIAQGADLDGQGIDGRTALHEAVLKHDKLSAELLLKAGARTDIADAHGKTALDYADKKMARVIEKAMPKSADTPSKLAQFFEEVGKANQWQHGSPTMNGWFIG